jgi:hypothetical protein
MVPVGLGIDSTHAVVGEVALPAQERDVRVKPLSSQSLVKSMASGVFARSCLALNSPRPVDVVKVEGRRSICSAVLARAAIHLKRLLAEGAAVVSVVLVSGVVVGPRFIQVRLAKMLSAACKGIAVPTDSGVPILVIFSEGFA